MAVVIILFLIFHSTPNETTTTPNSAIKNAQESYKTDTLTNVGQTVIDQTGNQAIKNTCENGSSQACDTAQSSFVISSITYSILIAVLFIAGIIGFVRWGIAAIGSIISNI